jgi:hypothetical protein
MRCGEKEAARLLDMAEEAEELGGRPPPIDIKAR